MGQKLQKFTKLTNGHKNGTKLEKMRKKVQKAELGQFLLIKVKASSNSRPSGKTATPQNNDAPKFRKTRRAKFTHSLLKIGKNFSELRIQQGNFSPATLSTYFLS